LEKIGETIFKVIYSDSPQEKFIYDKDQNIADKAKADTIFLQKQGQRKLSHCQIKLFDN